MPFDNEVNIRGEITVFNSFDIGVVEIHSFGCFLNGEIEFLPSNTESFSHSGRIFWVFRFFNFCSGHFN